jgi:hypothetical protein
MQTVLEVECWLPRKQLGCETPEYVLLVARDAITDFLLASCDEGGGIFLTPLSLFPHM